MLSTSQKTITRSRNGCAVCKSKRLKCDELKPNCSRCKRLGIPCPGYQKPLRWSPTSRSPRIDITTPTNSEPESRQQRTKDQCRSLQSFDSSGKNLCDVGLFSQFANINTPASIDFQDGNHLEHAFPFSDLPAEPPTPFTILETSCSTWLPELATDDLWPNITPNSPGNGLFAIEKRNNPVPSRVARYESPLSPSLQDNTSVLVEYYFKEVCGMMSCYDSNLNPYRTTISNLWGNSPSLYYVTQSMAAACLAEVSPGLSTASGRLRDQAVNALWKESKAGPTDTSSLLALVMLGFSLCWHDPSKLGQSEFELLAETLLHLEAQESNLAMADKQKRFFFYNSLVYWRMLLSFVTDQELASPTSTGAIQPQPPRFPSRNDARMPHPQTGIGVEVLEIVGQVGALVRKERKRIRSRQRSSRHDIEQSVAAIQTAEQLHSRLCKIELPREVTVMDSGDDMTPTDHLLKAAEAYRCTGLLQLYRNFPDLLLQDVASASPSAWLDIPGDTDPSLSDDSETVHGTWLTCLALHILDLLQDIPITSRSRSIQPLLLVSICSELSMNRGFASLDSVVDTAVASIASSPRLKVVSTTTDILHARRLVLSRLASFEGILAAKPIRQMIILAKETWTCMDEKQQDVYWMDVMMEKGYETLMG
ncbi:fungal-specific transcription factor domain-containing protein [Colletotrichum godetiae]|uniref:Fungal-specific transcription factor domain-containing protein n=1 Tax=Colletotrichum godetiae TaxID=1209918 RepID=A0AAJ0AD11_9PEZI|nr:fungal-specific transcription factor domain-containing protein [Colletotrichum godetiae]KAK1671644.1 fungal-specific transcription factor domain-containing protein [Colletotrichum godetiae]